MRGRVGMTLAAAAAAIGAGVPATAGAVGNGKIVFANLQNHIVSVNPDGTGATDLTPDPTALDRLEYCDPQWSPDGRRIAFIKTPGLPDQRYSLWVMNADGSGKYLIPSAQPATCERLAWSPDGTKIAYTVNTEDGVTQFNGNWEIDVVASNGLGLPRRLTNGNGDFGPSWSPDGKSIAYWEFSVPGANFQGGVKVIPASGGTSRVLPNSLGYIHPDWSPDGTRLITDHYASYPINAYEIWTISATDGTPLQRVTNGDNDGAPAWSPDGTKFVYQRSVTVNGADYKYIATDPIDGSGTGTRVALIGNTGGTYLPDWQPVP